MIAPAGSPQQPFARVVVLENVPTSDTLWDQWYVAFQACAQHYNDVATSTSVHLPSSSTSFTPLNKQTGIQEVHRGTDQILCPTPILSSSSTTGDVPAQLYRSTTGNKHEQEEETGAIAPFNVPVAHLAYAAWRGYMHPSERDTFLRLLHCAIDRHETMDNEQYFLSDRDQSNNIDDDGAAGDNGVDQQYEPWIASIVTQAMQQHHITLYPHPPPDDAVWLSIVAREKVAEEKR